MQLIDYSALEKYQIKKNRSSLKGTLIGISVLVGFLPGCIILFMLLSLFPLLWIGVAVLLIVLARKGQRYTRRLSRAFDTFVLDNGWQQGGESPSVPLMEKVHNTSGRAKISGQIDELPFWYYNSFPSKGADRNSLPVTLLTIQLPKPVPTIILAPNLGIFASMMDKIAQEDFGLQRITLEGDFSDTVRMYIPEGSAVEALSYITPEVMLVVRDKVSTYVMYSGNYISTTVEQDNRHMKLKQLFESMQLIAKEVKEKQNL